jgi:hypothetical protein
MRDRFIHAGTAEHFAALRHAVILAFFDRPSWGLCLAWRQETDHSDGEGMLFA